MNRNKPTLFSLILFLPAPATASAHGPDIGTSMTTLAGIGGLAYLLSGFVIAGIGGHLLTRDEPVESRSHARSRAIGLCLGIGITGAILWTVVLAALVGLLAVTGGGNLDNWIILGVGWLVVVPLTHALLVAALIRKSGGIGTDLT